MGNICDFFCKKNDDTYPNTLNNYYNHIDLGISIEEYNKKISLSDISLNGQTDIHHNNNIYYYNEPMIFDIEGLASGVLLDELIGD